MLRCWRGRGSSPLPLLGLSKGPAYLAEAVVSPEFLSNRLWFIPAWPLYGLSSLFLEFFMWGDLFSLVVGCAGGWQEEFEQNSVFSWMGIAGLRRRRKGVCSFELLCTGLHERGGCTGAGVSVVGVVVSTLFPKFLIPSSSSEGEEEARPSSPLLQGTVKHLQPDEAQALSLLLRPQDDTQQRRISRCGV